MQLTPQQFAQAAYDVGFRGSSLLTIIEIAAQESNFDTSATHVNAPGLGYDRGVLQWNSVYWPQISDTCAYDLECSLRWAWSVTQGGRDFGPWSLDLTTGRAQAHYELAASAMAAITGSAPLLLPSTVRTLPALPPSQAGQRPSLAPLVVGGVALYLLYTVLS